MFEILTNPSTLLCLGVVFLLISVLYSYTPFVNFYTTRFILLYTLFALYITRFIEIKSVF